MILVIGANGRLGRLVVKELVSEFEIRPRIMVRDAESARARFGDDVEIVTGDLSDPSAVDHAMHNIEAVFLCSPVHPEQVVMQDHVVRAAARENTHVVKLSGLATFKGSFVDSGRWHSITEAAIRDAGVHHTFLHPYFFTQNLAFQIPAARKNGVIRSAVPEASIAMVDTRDIAAVAARLLIDPSLARDQTLPLTSDATSSFRQIAGVFSEMLGETVHFQPQSLTELESGLRKSGQPEWHVQILLQFNRAFNEGLASQVDPAVRNILGRAPLTLADSLSHALAEANKDTNPFPS